MKRIGIVHAEPYPEESRLEKESRALASAGYEIHIFCLRRKGEQINENIEKNILLNRYAIYDNPFLRKWDTLVFSLNFDRPMLREKLSRFITDFDIDALHVVNLPLARIGIESARKRKIPVVLDFYENYPYGIQIWQESTKWRDILKKPFKKLARWLEYERNSVIDSSATIVDSVEFKQRLVENGLPDSKITVVQNTVDPSYFLPVDKIYREKYSDKFVMIYLGVIGPQKGIDIAIEALPRIAREIPNALLLCVGKGFPRHIKIFKDRAKYLGVLENIKFIDRVPHKEIMSVLSAGNVGILHLVYNMDYRMCSPHKLFEYMLAGLPVIVSPAESVARVVNSTGCGIVVGYNPEEFSSAVIDLAKNPEKIKLMGEAGKNAVEREFNWQNDAKKLIEIYENIL